MKPAIRVLANLLAGRGVGEGQTHLLSRHAHRGLVAFLVRVLAVREHWPQIVPLEAPAAGPSARV